jgi:erythromycin esterase-like protein
VGTLKADHDRALVERISAVAILRPDGDGVDEIARRLAGARLVLLGEATHGTHEFYRVRAALTRKLIADHGFTAVAIEGDWPDARRVDRYVRGLPGDRSAFDALGSFRRFPAWMWRNTDVVELVDWLRAHNDARPPAARRVGFYGLDLYSLHASIAAVLEYLDRVDPEGARRARARYACFDHAASDPQSYGFAAQFGLRPACEEEVVAQLTEILQREWTSADPADDDWFDAAQQARVVRNAETYYRTMFLGRVEAWNVRDLHMADTLDLIADHHGTRDEAGRVIVWAHNSHVGDGRATEMSAAGQLTLGQLARTRHPGQVALVGLTTHDGSVIAASDWDAPAERKPVRAALPWSWEAMLHQVDHGAFALATGDVADLLPERGQRLERAIGVIYRAATERVSHYLATQLGEQFDLIVHVDRTQALEPLERLAPTAAADHEAPETFPTGI